MTGSSEVSGVPASVSIGFLALDTVATWPGGFYVLLHWVVAGSAVAQRHDLNREPLWLGRPDRPSHPQRKMMTATTVDAMKRKTSCFPLG